MSRQSSSQPSQKEKQCWDNIVELIKQGDPRELNSFLRQEFRQNGDLLARVFEMKKLVLESYPLSHYPLLLIEPRNIQSLLNQKEIADLLIEYGASKTQKDCYNRSFAEYKELRYIHPLLEILLNAIDIEDIEKIKADLILIANQDHKSLQEILTVTINLPEDYQCSILHYCLKERRSDRLKEILIRKEITDLLIPHGANKEQEDSRNENFQKCLDLNYVDLLFIILLKLVQVENVDLLQKFLAILNKRDPVNLKEILTSTFEEKNISGEEIHQNMLQYRQSVVDKDESPERIEVITIILSQYQGMLEQEENIEKFNFERQDSVEAYDHSFFGRGDGFEDGDRGAAPAADLMVASPNPRFSTGITAQLERVKSDFAIELNDGGERFGPDVDHRARPQKIANTPPSPGTPSALRISSSLCNSFTGLTTDPLPSTPKEVSALKQDPYPTAPPTSPVEGIIAETVASLAVKRTIDFKTTAGFEPKGKTPSPPSDSGSKVPEQTLGGAIDASAPMAPDTHHIEESTASTLQSPAPSRSNSL